VQANKANRRGALALSDDVLTAVNARIHEEVTSYFGIAARALAEGATLAEREPPGEPRRTLIEKFSSVIVKHVPQIIDFVIADADGNFMMVWQNDATGGIDTKLIQNAPGNARHVLWFRRNAAGEVIGREEDPNDTYDPRPRPWYAGALKTDEIFWSDVYIFFTGNKPGITAATRYQTVEGRRFVVGVDLTLERLSAFLANLKIGKTGRAMIVDGTGRFIAHPQKDRVLRHDEHGFTVARIDQIGDAPATRAFDYFRVNGPGNTSITVDDVRYLAAFSPLKTVGRDWSILIVLPEDDFVGFVARNNRSSLLMSLAIVGLAVLMAGLLLRQGLRTDRTARLLRERSHAMARQSQALDLIADETDLDDPSRSDAPQALTETAAEITGARRASLWYLEVDRNVLRCADSYDSETSLHSAGFEVHRDELPHFFGHIAEGSATDVADAANDPRTSEVYRLLMAPLGSRSLSITPMRRRGHCVGGVWLEDAANAAGARDFLRVLAGMGSQHAGKRPAEPTVADVADTPRPAEPTVTYNSSPNLASRFDPMVFADQLYPTVAVMVMRIEENAAAADGVPPTLTTVDTLTRTMQEIAAEQDIPYLKLVGCEIIGAAGFTENDPSGAERVANTAIATRDRLADLFDASNCAPGFRCGIDYGVAIGGMVGGSPSLFNLWGAAVQTAQVMAETALSGSIQISEATYHQLCRRFLLRPRGTFFQSGIGRAQTFVLASRL
jgi:adenylate cyclase